VPLPANPRRAGWHSSPQLILPKNIVLMPLPSYAPELNSVETYGTICAATSQPLRLGHLRGDPRRLLRCLERPHGKSEVIVSMERENGTGQTWAVGIIGVFGACLACQLHVPCTNLTKISSRLTVSPRYRGAKASGWRISHARSRSPVRSGRLGLSIRRRGGRSGSSSTFSRVRAEARKLASHGYE